MRALLVCAVAAAFAAPAQAAAGHWAVGATPARFAMVRAQLPSAQILIPGRAVLVVGGEPHVRGAQYVERLDDIRRSLAFDNTEPLASKQWYLPTDRAWNFWPTAPQLAPVTVAVVDSGIDYGHPEFAGRILAGRSFVSGSWKHDADGHGTFVAGEIAADPFNGQGIAGLAFNAKLLIAKVLKPDGSVSLQGEIEAIRWAAERGARVINLSIGGVRDPENPRLDTYSAAEQSAVEYAYSKGAIVVAAAGNGSESPATPWGYADYPAALPHVIGVGAVRQNGSVPQYSNRDVSYVDLVAPGDNIFSTVPRNLVDNSRPLCAQDPYSDCGPFDYRNAVGTSFATPQVSAAAALLLGDDPSLAPDEVSWLLERTAADETPATGCSICPPKRDSLTGWGRVDVFAALRRLASSAVRPAADVLESNDDAGKRARRLERPRTISATLDYWDDPVDVYAVSLRNGERLYARATSSGGTRVKLVLWKPGTIAVSDNALPPPSEAARSKSAGGQQRLAISVPFAGLYYLEVRLDHPSRNPVAYTLAVAAPG